MNLIFDFDGTICDSSNIAFWIANKFLKENNREPITEKQLRDVGVEAIIKNNNIPLVKLPGLINLGRKELAKNLPFLKPFPDIKKVLKILHKNNLLFVITSNAKENVQKFLENNDLPDVFKLIDDSNDLFGKDKKINKLIRNFKLKKEDTCYIGDETRDVKAAKKSGVKSVAVTWGYESEKVLRSSNPDIMFFEPNDLLKL